MKKMTLAELLIKMKSGELEGKQVKRNTRIYTVESNNLVDEENNSILNSVKLSDMWTIVEDWKPKINETYWTINENYFICEEIWGDSEEDNQNLLNRNVFNNSMDMANFSKTKSIIRKLSKPFEYEKENHYLVYCPQNKSIHTQITQHKQVLGSHYFTKQNIEKLQQIVSKEMLIDFFSRKI